MNIRAFVALMIMAMLAVSDIAAACNGNTDGVCEPGEDCAADCDSNCESGEDGSIDCVVESGLSLFAEFEDAASPAVDSLGIQPFGLLWGVSPFTPTPSTAAGAPGLMACASNEHARLQMFEFGPAQDLDWVKQISPTGAFGITYWFYYPGTVIQQATSFLMLNGAVFVFGGSFGAPGAKLSIVAAFDQQPTVDFEALGVGTYFVHVAVPREKFVVVEVYGTDGTQLFHYEGATANGMPTRALVDPVSVHIHPQMAGACIDSLQMYQGGITGMGVAPALGAGPHASGLAEAFNSAQITQFCTGNLDLVCDVGEDCLSDCDGVCDASDAFGSADCPCVGDNNGVCDENENCPADCNGTCEAGDAPLGSADCDGTCGAGEDGSSDCDGTCAADGSEDGSADCDGVCAVDGSEDGSSDCDGTCAVDDSEDGSTDCNGVCAADGSEDGSSDCDGVCAVDGSEDGSSDCDGTCAADGSEDGGADCDGTCVAGEDGSTDCDGTCAADGSEDGSADCDGLCAVDGSEDGSSDCDGTCAADGSEDGGADCNGTCAAGEDGSTDCDGTCAADGSEDGSADCDGLCAVDGSEDGSSDCDGTCVAGEDGSSDCDGTCAADGSEDAGADCDGLCAADGSEDASSDCDGVCDVGEDGAVDCDGTCDAGEDPASEDCRCSGNEDGACAVGEDCPTDCDGVCSGLDEAESTDCFTRWASLIVDDAAYNENAFVAALAALLTNADAVDITVTSTEIEGTRYTLELDMPLAAVAELRELIHTASSLLVDIAVVAGLEKPGGAPVQVSYTNPVVTAWTGAAEEIAAIGGEVQTEVVLPDASVGVDALNVELDGLEESDYGQGGAQDPNPANSGQGFGITGTHIGTSYTVTATRQSDGATLSALQQAMLHRFPNLGSDRSDVRLMYYDRANNVWRPAADTCISNPIADVYEQYNSVAGWYAVRVCHNTQFALFENQVTAEGAGDPHFEGFHGGWYDFMGEAGKVFNIFSDVSFAVNARFVDFPDIAPGATYMGDIGVLAGTHRISFSAAGVARIPSAEECVPLDAAQPRKCALQGGGYVSWSDNSLTVVYGMYRLRVRMEGWEFAEGVADALAYDLSIDESAKPADWAPHGVHGQTAAAASRVVVGTGKQGEGVVQGHFLDYEVRSGDLFGVDHAFNRFDAAAAAEGEEVETAMDNDGWECDATTARAN